MYILYYSKSVIMSETWHAWFSAQAQVALRDAEIHSEIPVYFCKYTKQPVEATFVTAGEELDFFCEWEDLEYVGPVERWRPPTG